MGMAMEFGQTIRTDAPIPTEWLTTVRASIPTQIEWLGTIRVILQEIRLHVDDTSALDKVAATSDELQYALTATHPNREIINRLYLKLLAPSEFVFNILCAVGREGVGPDSRSQANRGFVAAIKSPLIANFHA